MQTLTSMSLRNAPTIYVSVNRIIKDRTKGIWIAKDEIQTIEFLGFEEGDDNSESGEASNQ